MKMILCSLFIILLPFTSCTSTTVEAPKEVFQNFKTVLTFFSEPYLVGAKLRDEKMEGFYSVELARKMLKVLEQPGFEDIQQFRNYLEAGTNIRALMDKKLSECRASRQIFLGTPCLRAAAFKIESEIMKAIAEMGGLIIPSGWYEHAVYLIIKTSPEKQAHYDLTVVNSGEGSSFHHTIPDPKNIYPSLTRIWLEFKDISAPELFSEESWFAQGLLALQTSLFGDVLDSVYDNRNKRKHSYPLYFYGTFLSKLHGNLVPVEEGKNAQGPGQRSGSCALSGLIGALHYESTSERDFMRYSVRIGQVLMEELLQSIDTDEIFKRVVTDGFNILGRIFFRGLTSSIAQQILQYLEVELPEHFQDAGLIGAGRPRWLFEKKQAAIEALTSRPEIVRNINIAIGYCKTIFDFLRAHPVRDATKKLVVDLKKEVKDANWIEEEEHLSLKSDAKVLFTDIYQHLKGPRIHPEPKIKTFNDLKFALIRTSVLPVDSQYLKRIFAIFKSLYIANYPNYRTDFNSTVEPDWDVEYNNRIDQSPYLSKILEGGTETEYLQLLTFCGNIVKTFADPAIATLSFDDVVLLMYLENLSWRLAVAYDNIAARKMGLGGYFPPLWNQLLKRIVGHSSDWIFNNNFDGITYEMFDRMLMTTLNRSDRSVPRLLGPDYYIDASRQDQLDLKYDIHKAYKAATEIPEYYNRNKTEALRNLFKASIKNGPPAIFPHFSLMMDTFAAVRVILIDRFRIEVRTFKNSHWIDRRGNHAYAGITKDPERIPEQFDLIRTPLPQKEDSIFYRMRHSYAFYKIRRSSLDSWLNYIKDARTAKIFDSSHFQYISDHLLNVPKYNNTEINSFGSVDNSELFPFNEESALSITKELTRLIGSTLRTLSEQSHQLSDQKRNQLVSRAVNMTIITTRFIERVDSRKKLSLKLLSSPSGREFMDRWNSISGTICAELLADLYNLVYPFSLVKSEFQLTSTEVSCINLALSKISGAFIRNSATFLDHLNWIKTASFTGEKFRKTLERYHWFVAKSNYSLTGAGTSIMDDQFIYGINGNKIDEREAPFLEFILKTHFLPSLALAGKPSSTEIRFKYHADGQVVEIHWNSGSNLMINLVTACMVQNNLNMLRTNEFTNSTKFHEFFKLEYRHLASNGTAFEAAGQGIYVLHDFKGSSYIITKKLSQEAFVYTFLRKWNGIWYIWTEAEKAADFIQVLGYNWIEGAKIYKRQVNPNEKEFLIFHDDEAMDPLVKAVMFKDSGIVQFSIHGMDGDGWTVTKDDSSFEKHIGALVDKNFLTGVDRFGRSIAVLPGYRLSEDLTRPLTLMQVGTEREGIAEFKVLNVPDLTIVSDQSIDGEFCLKGSLVAVSESKRVLLLPLLERTEFSKIPQERGLVAIQTIPFTKGLPAPQSRAHRLLTAYYLIIAHNYKLARDLLHPAASIQHNESFSKEELKIISWIINIDLKAPEITTLKFATFIHFRINSEKFPLYYENNKKEFEPITGHFYEVENLSISYLFCIRELSEKFYIYRIFPEVLRKEWFYRIFPSFSRLPSSHNVVTNHAIPESVKFNSEGCKPEKYLPATRVSANNLYYYLQNIGNVSERELNEAKAFMHKTLHSKWADMENEILLYCLIEDPDSWKYSISEDKKTLIVEPETLRYCYETFRDIFVGINQSRAASYTDQEKMRKTMQQDVGQVRLKFENNEESSIDESKPTFDLVSETEKQFINAIASRLRSLLKYGDSQTDTFDSIGYFAEAQLRSSTVLQNLLKSIYKFAKENGHAVLKEVAIGKEILESLNFFFENRLDELIEMQQTAAGELAQMTNLESSQSPSKVFESLLRLMHHRKSKTFSSLYACYLQDSLACIQKKFPQLDASQCVLLKDQAAIFFSRQILIDYYTMLKGKLNALRSSVVSVDNLIIFCDDLDKINSFNERVRFPVIMNFEFRSGKYHLRSEQVKDIELFTSIDESTGLFKSSVIQRMMAAGKTLVLGTISVVTKALDNAQLSVLVPPSSLYQSNTTAMQNRTYSYFKKKGNTFHFPRFPLNSKTADLQKLETYLRTVKEIVKGSMSSSNYLILSPETLHVFLNSYIEAIGYLNHGPDNGLLVSILNLYAEIYTIFRKHGSIILDEIDMTMDPKKELNFPTEETEPYNKIAVALLADIMEFMLFDREIIAAGLSIHSNNQASLTSKQYIACRDLILNYIEGQLSIEDSLWHKEILKNYNVADEIIIELVMEFLRASSMAEETEWIEELHEEQPLIANALIIVKAQLYLYIEGSLKGAVNQNFGSAGLMRPEIKFAVPFVAANTPSTSSVFADRWETLIMTLLMASAAPASRKTAQDLIGYYKKAISAESSDKLEKQHTISYQNLKAILPDGLDPVNLDMNNDAHVDMIHRELTCRSPAAVRVLFSYYVNEVLGKMTFPVEQITSNALNMASMFGSNQGYSGTINNVNILPQCVIKGAFDDHEANEVSNGGIALKLIQDSENHQVPDLDKESFLKSAEEMIQDVTLALENGYAKHRGDLENITAIIDTGAFFKNFKNKQVAEAVLSHYNGKFKAVLYYDEDSNRLEFVKLTQTGLITTGFLDTTDPEDILRATHVGLEERFTFYDQRHITGSDILQPKGACAVMTAGPRVLLRDMLQGTLRMRQFMSSQKVFLLTTTATRNFYHRGKITEEPMKVADVLALGALNEDEKQAVENEKLAFAKIDAEIRTFVLDEISRNSENDVDKTIAMFNSVKSLFIRSIRENPLTWLKESRVDDKATVLKSFYLSRIRSLWHVISKHFDESTKDRFYSMHRKIKQMISKDSEDQHDSLLFYLKTEQIPCQLNQAIGTEVQLQAQTLVLADLDLKHLTEDITMKCNPMYDSNDGGLVNHLLMNAKSPRLEANCKYFASFDTIYFHPEMNLEFRPYLQHAMITKGMRIGVTKDLVRIFNTGYNYLSTLFPIFSKYTVDGSHLLIQISTEGHLKVLLLSPDHAAYVLDHITAFNEQGYSMTLIKTPPPADYKSLLWLCDLSATVLATNDHYTREGADILEIVPESSKLIFDLLIFNGSLPQILAKEPLKQLLFEVWLDSEHFQERASFLLKRMELLQEKSSYMFEDEDEIIGRLKRHAMGQRYPEIANEIHTNGYLKAPVSESENLQTCAALNIKRSRSKADLDKQQVTLKMFDELCTLFGIESSEPKSSLPVQYGLTTSLDSLIDIDYAHDLKMEIKEEMRKRRIVAVRPFEEDESEITCDTSDLALEDVKIRLDEEFVQVTDEELFEIDKKWQGVCYIEPPKLLCSNTDTTVIPITIGKSCENQQVKGPMRDDSMELEFKNTNKFGA